MNIPFRSLLTYAFGLLLAGGIVAAKTPTEHKQYDYVTLVQSYNQLLVSYGSEKFEATETKIRTEGNFTPVLLKVGELEAQGYELVQNNMTSSGQSSFTRNYVLMRKPK